MTDPRFTGPGPDQVYREHLAAGRFMVQRCGACMRYVFHPRTLCSHCDGGDLAFTRVSGRGVVYSTSVNRRRPEAGGPINIALIDLEEGPRLMSRVEGVAPDAVAIGMCVRAKIIAGVAPLLVFEASE